MKTDDYKSLRRYVSHDLFRNGFLHRLGAPEIFFHGIERERELALAACLEQIPAEAKKRANLDLAFMTWHGTELEGEGLETLIMVIHSRARTLRSVRPADEFPGEDEVREWLGAVREYLGHTQSFMELSPVRRRTLALEASRGLRKVYDFIGALDIHSPRYWRLFVPTDR